MTAWHEFWTAAWNFLDRHSSGIGILLSLLGFAVTWWQLIKTRSAADAAERASKAAMDSVGRADTISDISRAQAGYHELQLALRGARFETALLRSQALRELLARIRARSGFEAEARQLRIQKMVTDLRRVQDGMEKFLSKPELAVDYSPVSANKGFSDAAAELGSWIEELRYRSGGNHDS